MFLLNTTAVADAAQLEDGLRLSSVIRSFIEWFFTPAEVELYSPWIDFVVVAGTLFLVFKFLSVLCGRDRRAKK